METIEMNKGTWSQRSDSIAEIAKALCKTQATVEAVKKDASNPFFKSKYADLASIWHAIREPLTSNGLSVLQEPSTEGNKVKITTTLMHVSGEFLRSVLEVPAVKVDPQGIGSAITYARRYALGAIVGIAPEDDDGNAASGGGDRKPNGNKTNPRSLGLQSADELQAEAAKKAFKGDDISFDSKGKKDLATRQVISAGELYTYNLKSYLDSADPEKYNKMMRYLEKKAMLEISEGVYQGYGFDETLKDYISAEEAA